MVDKLRLEVLLAAVDKVSGPLKAIATGSKATAQALGETEVALKNLERHQRELTRFEQERDKLDNAREQMQQAKALNASAAATKQLTADYEKQLGVVKKLQASMAARGFGDATVDQRQLAASIAAANTQIDAQRRKLEQQRQVEERLHALREKHGADMARLGMRGAMAAGAMMAGQKMGGAIMPAVTAFADAEEATSQLRAAMMGADGSVSAEFAKINALAERLGDRLPGTTADFIEMMTMLRRQGISAQTILGGTGEAAAYLGVQLKMPVTAAAEFAAKMQDATQTAERDMMGLMDMIQRTFYLGVDHSNMLQGFTKTAAVMPLLGKKGLEAANMIAPMLVMMDQAGMKGEASGNAIRKVVQMAMDAGKLGKANKMLQGTGVQLEFFDKAGKFAGFENLFAQLDKLKKVSSDVDRIAVMKKLFGDDAETHQVLNTLMEKGQDGYREVEQKMRNQADLMRRVNEELNTLKNRAEAAQGSFTNMLKELGASIAPELKVLLDWLGELAAKVGEWARENPRATKTLMLLAAGTAALLVVLGGLGMALVAVLGPLAIVRFLAARFGLGLLGAKVGAQGAAGGVGGLVRAVSWLKASWVSLRTMGIGGIFKAMGSAMASPAKWLGVLRGGFGGVWRLLTAFARANPIAALVLGLVGLFAGLYAHWDKITEYFNAGEWWNMAKEIWAALEWGFNAATMGLYELLKSVVMKALGAVWDGIKSMVGMGSDKTANTVRAAAAASAIAVSPMAQALHDGQVNLQRPGAPIAQPVQIAQKTGAPSTSNTNHITVNAAPGMDAQAVGRAVSSELDRRERAADSRRYSRLSDID